jgi:hypothetical protein
MRAAPLLALVALAVHGGCGPSFIPAYVAPDFTPGALRSGSLLVLGIRTDRPLGPHTARRLAHELATELEPATIVGPEAVEKAISPEVLSAVVTAVMAAEGPSGSPDARVVEVFADARHLVAGTLYSDFVKKQRFDTTCAPDAKDCKRKRIIATTRCVDVGLRVADRDLRLLWDSGRVTFCQSNERELTKLDGVVSLLTGDLKGDGAPAAPGDGDMADEISEKLLEALLEDL